MLYAKKDCQDDSLENTQLPGCISLVLLSTAKLRMQCSYNVLYQDVS